MSRPRRNGRGRHKSALRQPKRTVPIFPVTVTAAPKAGELVFIEHVRVGPTVRVGPFNSLDDAFAWIEDRSPNEVWTAYYLQHPSNPSTPDWTPRRD